MQFHRVTGGLLIAGRPLFFGERVLIEVDQKHVLHGHPPGNVDRSVAPSTPIIWKSYDEPMLRTPGEVIESVYRSDWGRIVATLIKQLGDFDLAEECAQEAFAAAVDQWAEGIPETPAAWLLQTARHKAIDRIRRHRRYSEK